MGGKSSSSQPVIGYWQKLLLVFGLGRGPFDCFLEMRGAGKTAFIGTVTGSGTITIDAENLWGGEKGEGGIAGDADLMFGEQTQEANAYLEANLEGLQSAHRGKFLFVFKGGKWGAFTGSYPKSPSFKVAKVLEGWGPDGCWYPEKAAVPPLGDASNVTGMGGLYVATKTAIGPTYYRADQNSGDIFASPAVSFSLCNPIASYDGTRLYGSNISSGFLGYLDVASNTWHDFDTPSTNDDVLLDPTEQWLYSINYATGTFYRTEVATGSTAYTASLPDTTAIAIDAGGENVYIVGNALGWYRYHFDGSSESLNVYGLQYDGTGAAVSIDGTRLYFTGHDLIDNDHDYLQIVDLALNAPATPSRIILPARGRKVVANPNGQSLAVAQYEPQMIGPRVFLVNLSDHSITTITVDGNNHEMRYNAHGTRLYVTCPGADVLKVIDTQPGSPTENTVIATFAFPNDCVGGLDVTGGGASISRYMNPAHMIMKSIIHPDYDGRSIAEVDEASFIAAADTLYDEGFGLCTTYDATTETVAAFRQRICNVIGGNVSRDRVTGLFYLDLFRANYVLDDLPILADDDVIEWGEEASDPLEAVNQLTVDWFDPEKKEKRTTAPLQALGAIMAGGGVLAESRSYPEIPYEDLALRVCARDLALKSPSLRRFTPTTNRAPYRWRVGRYFRLQAPRRGIADMVCQVGEVDAGTPRSGTIRLVAVQDVASLPTSVYVTPEPGVDTSTSTVPTAISTQRVAEVPFVELSGSMSRADLAALPDDVGYLMAMAKQPSNGLNYLLETAAGSEAFAEHGVGDWCPTALVVEAVTADPAQTDFTLSSGSRLSDVVIGQAAWLGEELVRVDALDVGTGAITLGRACGDTVPSPQSAGARIWFFDGNATSDGREYTESEIVRAKLLTRTATQVIPLSRAVQMALTMGGRQARPYPPQKVLLNSDVAPSTVTGPDIAVSWVHRDRLLQADQLVDGTAATVGPEAGTTYTVRYYADTVLEHTSSGVSGTSDTFTPAAVSGPYHVELESVRDGLTSFQKHSLAFYFDAGTVYLDDLAVAPRAVLSLKRLISTATVAVRVRRSSDDTETDIGFSGSDLDTAALATFVGSNSAYVTKIYDQTGNGEDFVETTNSKQPRIVNAGTYDGYIVFDGSDDAMRCTSLTLGTPQLGVYSKMTHSITSGFLYFLEGGSTYNAFTGDYSIAISSGAMRMLAVNASGSVDYRIRETSDTTGLRVRTFLFDRSQTGSGEMRSWKGGAESSYTDTVSNEQTGNFGTGDCNLCGRDGASDFVPCSLFTLVIYNADTSAIRATIEGLVA
jgi:hypothetical protein